MAYRACSGTAGPLVIRLITYQVVPNVDEADHVHKKSNFQKPRNKYQCSIVIILEVQTKFLFESSSEKLKKKKYYQEISMRSSLVNVSCKPEQRVPVEGLCRDLRT